MPPFDLSQLAPVLASLSPNSNGGFLRGWQRAQQEKAERQEREQAMSLRTSAEERAKAAEARAAAAEGRAADDQQLQRQQHLLQGVNSIRQLLEDPDIDEPSAYDQRLMFAMQMAPQIGIDQGFVQSLRPTADTFTKRKLTKLLKDLDGRSVSEQQQFEQSGQWEVGGQTYTPAQARAALGRGGVDARTGQPFAFTPPPAKPDTPNTPEEKFYQRYATERGAKSFDELPTADQAAARKQWMQADDRPLVVNTGQADARTNARIDRIVSSFNAHPIVKEYNETQAQQGIIRNIVGGQWSGPGDMAAVFAFMKALDPNSVVRETEYANAAKSGNIFMGWAARFNGAINPNGGFLSERVRQDFLRTIDARMTVKTQQYQNLRTQLVKRIDGIKAGTPETGDEALVDYTGGSTDAAKPAPKSRIKSATRIK